MATDDFSRYLNSTSSSEWFSTRMMTNTDEVPFDNPDLFIEALPPPEDAKKWFAEPFKFEIEEVLDEDGKDSSEKVMFDPENLVL